MSGRSWEGHPNIQSELSSGCPRHMTDFQAYGMSGWKDGTAVASLESGRGGHSSEVRISGIPPPSRYISGIISPAYTEARSAHYWT